MIRILIKLKKKIIKMITIIEVVEIKIMVRIEIIMIIITPHLVTIR